MANLKLANWLQIGANIGIIVGLVLVAMEINQANRIAKANAYQARANAEADAYGAFLESDQLFQAWSERFDMTENEVVELLVAQMLFNSWENLFFQQELDMLEPDHWESVRAQIRLRLADDFNFRYWEELKEEFRPAFVAHVDALLKESVEPASS